MLQIKKLGRWGVIEGVVDKKLASAFFNRLAYKRDGAHFMSNQAWAYVRFYNVKKQAFPSGLLCLVKSILGEWKSQYGEDYSIEEPEQKVISDASWVFSDRLYQSAAVNALLKNNGGIVALPTGSGKTKVALEYIGVSNHKQVLVIVTTRDLVEQWQAESSTLKPFVVVTYQWLRNHIEFLKNYDLVIFDECHHVSAKVLYSIAMKCSTADLVGLTATPYRAYEPETLKIKAALGPIVYQISLRELIDLGYLVDASIRIVSLNECKAELWDTYPDIVDKFIVNNKDRNKSIIKLALSHRADGTVLILVDRVEHGQILFDMFEVNDRVIFVHGSSKNRKKIFDGINRGEYDIVIASKIYGEGVNFPRLKTLILACGGQSSVAVVQKIGRLLRLFPGKNKALIYDFRDNCKYLKEHFKDRFHIYEKDFEVTNL